MPFFNMYIFVLFKNVFILIYHQLGSFFMLIPKMFILNHEDELLRRCFAPKFWKQVYNCDYCEIFEIGNFLHSKIDKVILELDKSH